MKTCYSFCSLAGSGLLLVLLLSVAPSAQAQTGGPAPGGGTSPTAVPIDGGASLLLAGGVAYGLQRLRKRRRNA